MGLTLQSFLAGSGVEELETDPCFCGVSPALWSNQQANSRVNPEPSAAGLLVLCI